MARNPFGRVPTFDHEGFVLYETQAVLHDVDQAFPGPGRRTIPESTASCVPSWTIYLDALGRFIANMRPQFERAG